MKKNINVLIIYLLTTHYAFCQSFSFSLDQNIKVSVGGVELANPWTGGLNSAQFSTIDMNGDKQQDLMIFDRTNFKVSTFLHQNGKWVYAPEYEAIFPIMENWCLLVDYDNDGKKDIFTATRSGVRVFRNITMEGGRLSFRIFKDALSVRSTTGNLLRLLPDLTDIPAIADIDNDGDLDILNFIPLTGQTIAFNKNLSIERYNRLDSLEFETATLQWGNISECSNCNEYFFGNTTCKVEQVEHSGHAMTILDLNGDNIKDFLLSDVNCTGVVAFTNKGTPTMPSFDSFAPNFPPANPVNMISFPATYYEDVDNDNVKDLIVSPNQFFNDGNRIDFTNSIWFYKNIGANNRPNFSFQRKNFLQDQTIDLGEFAKPTFADFDADGDLDLFVSNGGQALENQAFRAKIFLFENIGSPSAPSFRLLNDDYANFSTLNVRFLKINFADLNADGALDLAFTSVNNTNGQTSLRYTLNMASANQLFNFNINNLISITLPNLSAFDEPLLIDTDNDRDPDLLLGRFQGGLRYFENTGNLTFSLRNQRVIGIGDDFTERALSLAIADFNKNNKLDLVTGDRSGYVNVYPDFIEKLNDSLPNNRITIFNPILNQNTSYNFGREVSPAVYGDDLVVGLTGGGLQFLKNRNIVTAVGNEAISKKEIHFQLFPNPFYDKITIQTDRSGKIIIYNLLGIPLGDLSKIIPSTDYEISLRDLPKGVYFAVFMSDEGERVIKKIIKN